MPRQLFESWDLPEDVIEHLIHIHKDDVIWLRNNTEPYEDVINKWKCTFEYRQLLKYDTVESFIEKWPILNDVRRDVLIHLDFDTIYPGRGNNFYTLWNIFINKIKDKKSNLF